MRYIGVDLHKTNLVVCFLPTREPEWIVTFSLEGDGLAAFRHHEDRTWMPRPMGGEEKSSRRRRVGVRRSAWQASEPVMRSTRQSII
jgi:hypothetical protein